MAERRSGEQTIEVIGMGIAHEVKNALNGIGMNAQLVQQQCAAMPEDRRASLLKKIARIEDEAARTGAMLGEFLTYAKPAEFKPAPVNLVALLDDLAQFFEQACRARAITVSCSCHQSLTAVMADEQLLRHGLTNLMWNAIHAVEKDGTVALKGERRGDAVVLSVADTGGGIEPDRVAKVFDVFFSTKPRGAGLGLSIVQRVARMHGGDVVLDNRPGDGCTFTITFPWRPV
jgi:two-component system sensor histidine kinase HydH